MSTTVAIQLPKTLYDKITAQAAAQAQTPERFVIAILSEKVSPTHPYITIIDSRSGPRPVITGTRIGVDVVVGYSKAGYTPQEIADELLPHLTLAQVYDALSYFEDHRELMLADMSANTPDAWQLRLQQEMGETAVAQLLGQ